MLGRARRGAVDVLPDLLGARERWRRDFLHCPSCRGWKVRDQRIGVLGSVEHAHLLRQWSADVTLFTDGADVSSEERTTLSSRSIAVVDGAVQRLIVEDDRLVGVAVADGPRSTATSCSCGRRCAPRRTAS